MAEKEASISSLTESAKVWEEFSKKVTDVEQKLRKEHEGCLSLQINLKNALHNETEERKRREKLIETLEQENRISIADLETTISVLQSRLDTSEHARLLAEGRVSDLQVALSKERDRVDEATRHERRLAEGIYERFGVVRGPQANASEGSLRPIQTRRESWQSVATSLESKSRDQEAKAPKPDPTRDPLNDHWRKKIAEVEAKDNTDNVDHDKPST